MKNTKYLLILLVYLLSMGVVACEAIEENAFQGDAYWVSPSGTATWANAKSATPLSGTACCALATANFNARAGDTVILRGGTYNTPIFPENSGTSNARITYRAHSVETPILSTPNLPAMNLDWGRGYFTIKGITVRDSQSWLRILRGSSYNEVSYCEFGPQLSSLKQGVMIYNADAGYQPCTHNWIHHNTMHGAGYVTDDWDDQGHIMQVGVLYYDGNSDNNTIENNIIYHGGHHLIETYSRFNVIRDNVFHNECWMNPPGNPSGLPSQQPGSNGKYGNRCFSFVDEAKWNRDGVYNLAENNRFGNAGRPPDDDGADNVEFASHRNIFRYNYVFNAAKDGLYFRDTDSGRIWGSDNRVYNNTIYHNGVNESQGYDSTYRRSGIVYRTECRDNVIKNNISYGNYNILDIRSLYPDGLHGNTIENNWTTTNAGLGRSVGWGNPFFVNPDISDPMSTTLPDLRLQSWSPAIDRGTHLTRTTQAGSGSTTLVVEDALYFQDGSWGSLLSGVRADWIAIGTVNNTVQIKSINYATKVITLVEPRTWNAQAQVWLYSDSKGRRVLYGTATDIGAYEYMQIR